MTVRMTTAIYRCGGRMHPSQDYWLTRAEVAEAVENPDLLEVTPRCPKCKEPMSFYAWSDESPRGAAIDPTAAWPFPSPKRP